MLYGWGKCKFYSDQNFSIFYLIFLIISEIVNFETQQGNFYGDHIISGDFLEIKSNLLSRWQLKIYPHMKILSSDGKGEMTTG